MRWRPRMPDFGELLTRIRWPFYIMCGVGVTAFIGGFVASRFTDLPPVVVTDMKEADGVVYRGGMVDIIANVQRNRPCGADTQRWLWRNAVFEGKPIVQTVPLPATVMPAFVPDGRVMLTIPVPYRVPAGEWFYRAVTQERCSWLPSFLATRPTISNDVPLTILSQPSRP